MENKPVESLLFTFAVNDALFYVYCDHPFLSTTDNSKSASLLHMHYMNEVHFLYDSEEVITTLNQEARCEKSYLVKKGELLFIPKNLYHSSATAQKTSRLSLKFDIQYNPNSAYNHQYKFYYNVKKKIESLKEPAIFKSETAKILFEELWNCYEDAKKGDKLKYAYQKHLTVSSVIYEIVKSIISIGPLEDSAIKQEVSDSDRKYIIKDFISTKYASEHTLSDLSKTLHLSIRQTQNLINRCMGKNFKSLILEQKMLNAKLLIKNTKSSLKNISEDVGFSSYSSFYTSYLKFHGCTPSADIKSSN